MAERKGLHVVTGQQVVLHMVSAAAVKKELREGSTGRVVSTTLPKVWAVAGRGQAAEGFAGQPAAVRTTALQAAAAKLARPEAGVEVRFYRKYTEGLLRRYIQMSMEAGRVPSMMGREVLGGRASSYRIHGFDDAVNFRLDVEKCLRQLEFPEREVLRRVAMQEYTQAEAAAMLGICLRTCVERYGRSLDRLTGILLRARLLEPMKMLSMGRG